MPANRNFWRGAEISWRGELIEFHNPPHGGLFFKDWDCGPGIEVDAANVPQALFKSDDATSFYRAAATFDLKGSIAGDGKSMWLKPTTAKRISPWITGNDFDAHLRERFEHLRRTLKQ